MTVLAIRGIVRPSSLLCSHNIIRLAARVETDRVYMYTWRSYDSERLADILHKHFGYFVCRLDEEPSQQEILSKCWGRCKTMGKNHWKPENPYKQVLQTQQVLGMIDENPWVVLTRPDLMVDPGLMDPWKQEETYSMPEQDRYPVVNDQFAVGRKAVLLDAWSWGDAERMSVLLEGCENPEEALLKNIEREKIRTHIVRASMYRLIRTCHAPDL